MAERKLFRRVLEAGQSGGIAVTSVFARKALIDENWAEDVRLTIEGGTIQSVVRNARPRDDDDERYDIVVPGMPNLHSHAFQRAMAGTAEVRGLEADSFWSWRTIMYRTALSMDPDDVEAVAARLYMEMLEAGFTRVGEFHYLHHDPDGHAYANVAELAERVAAASVVSGIGLTLLPVFYAHSGFGGLAPAAEQRRFINSPERFARLLEGCRSLVSAVPGANLGLAPHSLRAVTPSELTWLEELAGDGPIHIHVAEQVKEAEDCLAWCGKRPVEWLLDNASVDGRWCLIHATHMTVSEINEMAKRGAVAGLCPITEANLGDGIFPAEAFVEAGGRFGIGSDSNVSISVAHELRQLEYSQRLGLRARNVISEPGRSTGRQLFDKAVSGGAAALKSDGGLAVGESADFVALDISEAFDGGGSDRVLDQWIFGDAVKIDSVWAQGKKVVAEGRHVERERISSRFRDTMDRLLDRGILAQ